MILTAAALERTANLGKVAAKLTLWAAEAAPSTAAPMAAPAVVGGVDHLIPVGPPQPRVVMFHLVSLIMAKLAALAQPVTIMAALVAVEPEVPEQMGRLVRQQVWAARGYQSHGSLLRLVQPLGWAKTLAGQFTLLVVGADQPAALTGVTAAVEPVQSRPPHTDQMVLLTVVLAVVVVAPTYPLTTAVPVALA